MSTASASVGTRAADGGALGWFRGLVGSEWVKFRATRSTYFALLATAVLTIGVGSLIAQSISGHWATLNPGYRASEDVLADTYRGFQIAQLIMGALGALAISSEYSSGLIRTTFAVAPQRRSVLAAKAVVVGASALVVGEVASFADFFAAQALFQPTGLSLSVTSPGALRAVTAAGFYLAVVALLGLALGALLRHTAGAISALFVLVFLSTDVVNSLPGPWNVRIGTWLPANMARQLTSEHAVSALLSRPVSFVMLIVYVLVLLGLAAWRLSKTDA